MRCNQQLTWCEQAVRRHNVLRSWFFVHSACSELPIRLWFRMREIPLTALETFSMHHVVSRDILEVTAAPTALGRQTHISRKMGADELMWACFKR